MRFSALFALVPVIGADVLWHWEMSFGEHGVLHQPCDTFFTAVNLDGSVKWIFDAQFPIVTYQETPSDTLIMVIQSTPTNRTFYCLDGPDGSILSQRPLLDTGACAANAILLLSSLSTTYVVCKDIPHSIIRIEAITVTGAEWFRSLPGTEVSLAPDGGVLIGAKDHETGQEILTALESQTGAVKWTRQMERFDGWVLSQGDISHDSVAHDIVVAHHRLVHDSDKFGYQKELLRLSGADGSIIWNASYGEVTRSPPDVRPISGRNGEVYISGMDNHILAFSADGNTSWTLPCADSEILTRYTHQNPDGTEEDIFISQEIREYLDNVTDVCTCSGTTARLLWNTSFAGQNLVKKVGPDGTVLATDFIRDQAVAIRQGDVAWRTRYFSNALMALDGTAYLQHWSWDSQDMNIEALDTNGVQKWSLPIKCSADGLALEAQSSFVSV